MQSSESKSPIALVDVISTAIQIPGIKVDRDSFLRECFKDKPIGLLNTIIEVGPVNAHCKRDELKSIAQRLTNERTMASTGMSFVAGIPGGIAMAATIPADIIQFYSVALRLAQEISYLYGEPDLWQGGKLDNERVINQLILYCGVMLGVSGASATVRVVSSALAKRLQQQLPKMALTKTWYYPIVKTIAKFFGAKMTKEAFAKSVSKALPVIGGIVSGGMTLATMLPMGKRLADTLDQAHFNYTDEAFEADWEVINDIFEEEAIADDTADEPQTPAQQETSSSASPWEEIAQAKQLLDSGMITEDEFSEIKAKIIQRI